MGFIKKAIDFLSRPTRSRTMGVLAILVLVSAIFLTVTVAQQQQTIKQHAAGPGESCTWGWECDDTECQLGQCWGWPNGTCVMEDRPNGESCNGGTCQGGSCVATCQRQCSGRQCGPDGCGGECGQCGSSYYTCNESTGQCEVHGLCLDYDCRGLDTDCGYGACNRSTQQCQLYPWPAGTSCPNGTCDGNGNCNTNTCTCPSDGNECTNDMCVNNVCEHTPKPIGTPCTDEGWNSGTCTSNGICDTTSTPPPVSSDTCTPNGGSCIPMGPCVPPAVQNLNYSCGSNPNGTVCCMSSSTSTTTGKCKMDATTKVCTDPDGTTHSPKCDGSSAKNYNCESDLTKPCKETITTCTSTQTCSIENYIAKCVTTPTTKPNPTCPPGTNPTSAPGVTSTPTPTSILVGTATLVSALNAQDVSLTSADLLTSLILYNLSTNTIVSGAPATQIYNSTSIPGRQYSATIILTSLYQEKYFIVIRYNNMIAKSVFTVSATNRTITVPTTTLVFGDVNNDNDINIVDYNIFKNCWKQPATGACSSSDFDTSGGNIDQVDYNTWLRGLATWLEEGQGL